MRLYQRQCGQPGRELAALAQQTQVTDSHPWPAGLDITDPNAAQVATGLPPVVLPHLWRALAEELVRWQGGGD
jgi:hypothetical protein